MKSKNVSIDFVLPWVDGNDPIWNQSFRSHLPESKKSDDARAVRYRDWGLLPYWFRGMELFAPWVNKIHFITCGHYPEWLRLDHPKLNFVRHEDYIPTEFLPTFSANPIELNLHRIKSLSEHFVLFNDDMFLTGKIAPEYFFRGGKPCDLAALDVIASRSTTNQFCHIVLNDVTAINQKFNKWKVLRNNWHKWIRLDYGTCLLRTLALLPWPYFIGFRDPHLPYPYLKSTMEEVWNEYSEQLTETSAHRFRTLADYSDWLFRYWQLVSGNFYPINVYRSSVYYDIKEETLPTIEKNLLKQKKKILVLNDVEHDKPIPFEYCQKRIASAFRRLFPEKSSFEK